MLWLGSDGGFTDQLKIPDVIIGLIVTQIGATIIVLLLYLGRWVIKGSVR